MKHVLLSASAARKHSESSAATTPRSYMSHDLHLSGKNSPSKSRMSPFRNLTDDGNQAESAQAGYISNWNTADCKTPTLSSKINGWDTSLAEEDGIRNKEGSYGPKNTFKKTMSDK